MRGGAFHDTEGAPTAGPPPHEVYEVVPATAFGFGTDESFSPTRWRFEGRPASDESDFGAIFGDDYLYFFSERLGDERSESEVETITSLLGLRAGEDVADIACGHGRIANRLARDGMVVKGVDAAAHYLDIARSQAEKWDVHVSYEEGDMRAIPWGDSSFDAAVIWATSFGYFSDEENIGVLQELGRVLRPGGRALIETFSKEWVVRDMDRSGSSRTFLFTKVVAWGRSGSWAISGLSRRNLADERETVSNRAQQRHPFSQVRGCRENLLKRSRSYACFVTMGTTADRREGPWATTSFHALETSSS